MNEPTIVTGFWNIGRDGLGGQWYRDTREYLTSIINMIKSGNKIIIYGDDFMEPFFHKKFKNVFFVKKDLYYFYDKKWFNRVDQIIKSKEWKQDSWIADSPLSRLRFYIPVVLSKVDLLSEASHSNPFNSNEFYWIDAGISRYEDVSTLKVKNLLVKDKIICSDFSYKGNEVHGFKWDEFCRYCHISKDERAKIFKANFFGGEVNIIQKLQREYNKILDDSLNNGLLGTEESILSIVKYRHPNYFQSYDLKNNYTCLKEVFVNESIN